ncbi:SdrD B-like domain-containing protein [Micromonospora sp. RTP1Z1]|uniref:SdrD B-like domain-containing protein n=1 Tax=Micromonospora sp. RTP1Z1 TaxID=2994043 RepID=UPI0029C80A79|nr:SdrD B-like domain-containing protein [Micromonospora sp. RTP1Z1]
MRSRFLSRSIRRTFSSSLATLALVGGVAALAPADAVAAGKLQPDLVVDLMMTDVLNPAEGETFNAEIDVRNIGTGASNPISVTISVPSVLQTTTPYPADAGWACTVASTTSYTCSYPELAAGGRAGRLFVPFVVAGAAPGSTVPITTTITPQRREANTDNNSGSVTVAISGTCTIRGTVWHDLDRDGQREAGEPGIAGGPDGVLNVHLAVREGQAIGGGSATVNPDGTWSITARTELLYTVWLEASGGYGRTVADVGDDATDSDMVTSYQIEPTLLVASDEFYAVHGGEYVVDAGLVTQS